MLLLHMRANMNKGEKRVRQEDGVSAWLKLQGKLFVGALTGYIAIAAITGTLTAEVLAVRVGMAIVSALLIGIAYQRLTKIGHVEDTGSPRASLKGIEGRQWRLLMWTMIAVVVVAFVVDRVT